MQIDVVWDGCNFYGVTTQARPFKDAAWWEPERQLWTSASTISTIEILRPVMISHAGEYRLLISGQCDGSAILWYGFHTYSIKP